MALLQKWLEPSVGDQEGTERFRHMPISIKGTFKYTAMVGGIVAVAALPLIAEGHRFPFEFGLACGIGASMAAFALSYRFIERATNAGGKSVAFIGIGLKYFIYLGVMYTMTALFGVWPGIGSAVGCLTAPAAVIILNVAVPKLRKLRGKGSEDECRQYIYESHMRGADGALRYVFMRGAFIEMASGGRIYMTHRRFRRLAEIRRVPQRKAAL
jgi:hypothetical protein